MPLPHNKRPPPKRTAKTVLSINADHDTERVSLAAALADVEGWEKIIGILSKVLKLPDLKTRSGLKEAYRSFDATCARLSQVYLQNSDNVKIIGGVVGIYAHMCVHRLLREKLFSKGFLKQLTPLLKHSETVHLALRTLLAITHHSAPNIHVQIVREYDALHQCILDFPEDVSCCELALATLCHCLVTVTFDETQSYFDPEFYNSLPLSSILTTLLKFVQRPDMSKFSLHHIFCLIHCALPHLPFRPALRSVPHAMSFLISNLRSTDLNHRAITIFSLLIGEGRVLDSNEPSSVSLGGSIGSPAHTETHFDIANWDFSIELETKRTWTAAIEQFREDLDFDKFAVTLAKVVLVAPRIAPSSAWLRANDLPDLKALATTLRASNTGIDHADVLDISHLVLEGQVAEACALATSACYRNPTQPAFYYFQGTLSEDQHDTGLRALKKGLKCDDLLPSLRFSMLAHAIYVAFGKGVSQLAIGAAWETGIALLVTALEDSEVYLRDSPPDASYRSSVLGCNLLLRLVLRDPCEDLSVHESDFEAVRKQIDSFAAIQKYTGSSYQWLDLDRILMGYNPSFIRPFGHRMA
ncbi:hypothetical protein BDZ89DRAFT_1156342 [Hymenopellis radicata]|nr:hypothetical protein BDZ89DRAFT_1156342 [Hymenopellis radicata]